MTIFNYPPGNVWGPATRPDSVVIGRSVLLEAKHRVIRWSDSAPGLTLAPVQTREYELAWTVTLDRVS